MSKHGDIWKSPCGRMELRCGRWQDVLADVEQCDAVITDPPYGESTHNKQFHGRRLSGSGNWCTSQGIPYDRMALQDIDALPQINPTGWLCVMMSHDLVPAYEASLTAAGRYVFAPLPCVIRGMNVRLAGDGPSSWCVWLLVSRPTSASKWGTLPGAHVGNREDLSIIGGKPLWLMRSIVTDYSRLDDLIVDPYAGSGTTLLAAAIEGRHAIGAEMDPKTFDLAVKRLSKGYTPRLQLPDRPKPKQSDLL